MITGLVGTVFDTDEPPFVSISTDVILDLVNQLINEYEDNDYIATVIDPGLE